MAAEADLIDPAAITGAVAAGGGGREEDLPDPAAVTGYIAATGGGREVELIAPGGGGAGPGASTDFLQRIYDSVVGWCYYTKTTKDPAPLPGETTPAHLNNLVAGTHVVLAEIESA